MQNSIDKVKEWQLLFGRNGHIVHDTPFVVDDLTAHRRVEFLLEESLEYLRGIREQDLIQILDALVDLQYFLFGMVVIHGFQDIFTIAFDTVHASNMSKLGRDGKPLFRQDGKIVKGPDYWAPKEELLELLKQYAGELASDTK